MIYCGNEVCRKWNPFRDHNCTEWRPSEPCGFTYKVHDKKPSPEVPVGFGGGRLPENFDEPICSIKFTKSSGGGVKGDSGKDRWDLLPWAETEQVVKVLTFGAKKYDDNNWQKVTEKPRYIAAAFRHIIARVKGEHMDQETGLPHLAHAVCCLLFLLWHDTNGGE